MVCDVPRKTYNPLSQVQLHLRHKLRQNLRVLRMPIACSMWHGKVPKMRAGVSLACFTGKSLLQSLQKTRSKTCLTAKEDKRTNLLSLHFSLRSVNSQYSPAFVNVCIKRKRVNINKKIVLLSKIRRKTVKRLRKLPSGELLWLLRNAGNA